ncbi:MAG: type I restriction enzyme HsdR N-terminal domain-containing protein [Chlamydiota bacterium]
MASYLPNRDLSIRKKALPEERLRRELLAQMVEELSYPKALIAVEKEIKHFAVDRKKVPQRRVDILCFDRQTRPLLLIECKAKAIDAKAVAQVLGYNEFIRAPIIGLAQPAAILLGWKKNGEQHYQWYSTLPTFDEVAQWV